MLRNRTEAYLHTPVQNPPQRSNDHWAQGVAHKMKLTLISWQFHWRVRSNASLLHWHFNVYTCCYTLTFTKIIHACIWKNLYYMQGFFNECFPCILFHSVSTFLPFIKRQKCCQLLDLHSHLTTSWCLFSFYSIYRSKMVPHPPPPTEVCKNSTKANDII